MSPRVLSCMLALLACVLGARALAHEPASKLDLKRAMLELQEVSREYFDHPRSAQVDAFIAKGHAQVRELARVSPDTRRIATVIFRRGLSSKELNTMVREFGILMHRAKVMFSMGGERDFSSELPIQWLYQRRDSELPATDWFVEVTRDGLRARAAGIRKDYSAQAAAWAANFEKLAQEGKPVWLTVSGIAKVDMLRLLADEADVYAVVMEPSAEKVSLLDDMHRRLADPAIQDVREKSGRPL
jgi:hypothetical protein